MRIINSIIVHCSDSDITSHDNIAVIKEWHLKRGFKDVGYHYFIRKSGHIEYGRPLHQQGAHVSGHNKSSIGICTAGRTRFTKEQLYATARLCNRLLVTFNLSVTNIYGHCDFNPNKTCPNLDMEAFRDLVFESIGPFSTIGSA